MQHGRAQSGTRILLEVTVGAASKEEILKVDTADHQVRVRARDLFTPGLMVGETIRVFDTAIPRVSIQGPTCVEGVATPPPGKSSLEGGGVKSVEDNRYSTL
jgi:hypothetical protein